MIDLFGKTNFINIERKFGIKTDDRRRHVYVIGKTGMGKTAMLLNMAIQDIHNGNGIGFVDPHGEAAEELLNFVPADRIKDVVYINPGDLNFPIAFNVMEKVSLEYRHLVAGGLMGSFKKIWPDVWSARMEYILNNTILALLESPNSTLLGINRMLSDVDFRKDVVSRITDPVVKSFWVNEFARYAQRYETEATAAIQNKIGQFISAPLIRNIIGQEKSTINMRSIMDSKKILIMNLSKGKIGEDNSALLGALLITKLHLAAMSRVDVPEAERKDFFLYVDEFQSFATESFANILSEARKYRLSLILAHQYIAQMEETVRDAVFGNVGTIISFRVGAEDAEYIEKEFVPEFYAADIVNLAKYNIYLKLMIDGLAGRPFSATTIEPFKAEKISNKEAIIEYSRKTYATNRIEVDNAIARWANIDMETTMPDKKPETTLYDAVCATCGKNTKVIFAPDGKRPIYCKNCLKKQKKDDHKDDHQDQQKKEPQKERVSLDSVIEKGSISFQTGKPEPRKKERKKVNLDELRETLSEALDEDEDSQRL